MIVIVMRSRRLDLPAKHTLICFRPLCHLLAGILALGQQVLVVHDGQAYQIVIGDDE